MQLTYNQFRKVVDKSSDKLFEKFTEIFAESENAALMALYDDKMILLDEDTNNLYICDYDYSDGVLSFSNFEPLELVENDSSYLEEKVNDLFDIVNDPPVTVDELLEGFKLRFINDARMEFNEAIYNKNKKIYENPLIKVKHSLREVRDANYGMIKELLRKPFMKKLQAKLTLEQENEVVRSLNKVDFSNKKGYKVDTNVYTYLQPDISKLDDEIKKKMKQLAGKLAKLWKTDSFRAKFEKFIQDINQSESYEEALDVAQLFFENNKELFLVEPSRLDEIILKTALMTSSSKDANLIVEIFRSLLKHPEVKTIKEEYFDSLGVSPEDIARLMFEQEDAETEEPAKEEPSAKADTAADDLETEELNDIIAVFKSIRKQLEDDSDEAIYIDSIIDDLENAKAKGIEDEKMRSIINWLASAKEEEAPEEEEEE